MRGAGLDPRRGFLQIEQRATARGAGDEIGAGDANPCRLKQAEDVPAGLVRRHPVDLDRVSNPVAQQAAQGRGRPKQRVHASLDGAIKQQEWWIELGSIEPCREQPHGAKGREGSRIERQDQTTAVAPCRQASDFNGEIDRGLRVGAARLDQQDAAGCSGAFEQTVPLGRGLVVQDTVGLDVQTMGRAQPAVQLRFIGIG